MILKQKKKLIYLLSLTLGLVLTVFAVAKDDQAKHQLVKGLSLPVANADTPTPPGDSDSTFVGGDDGGSDDADDGGGGS